jgi:hypothetical protein
MSGSLLDSTDWSFRNRIDNDRSFVKKPTRAADAITAASASGPPSLEVSVKPGEGSKETRSKQKARAFVDLVKNGLSPEDAAQRIGLELGEVTRLSSGTDMKDLVARTLEIGHIRSDIRKEFLRAGLNQSLAEALAEGDRREFGNLYKLAASDPEIGLTGPSTVLGVQVNIGEDGIGGLLKEFMGVSEPPQKIPQECVDLTTNPGLLLDSDAGDKVETNTDSPPSEN